MTSTVANLAFSLILTVFTPSADSLPRADVFVLDHNLTAEDCAYALAEEKDRPAGRLDGVLSCTVDDI